LLFDSRRYEHKSTVVTTNRPFAEWHRLVHHAEILAIEGQSYRFKEAQERADNRARQSRRSKS
jgi:hypothetical protein